MDRKVYNLTTDQVKTTTHYKIANIEIEIDRPYYTNPVLGYIKVWLEKVYYNGSVFEKIEGEPGVLVQFGEEWGTEVEYNYVLTEIINLTKLEDVETWLYSYFKTEDYIPSGSVEDI